MSIKLRFVVLVFSFLWVTDVVIAQKGTLDLSAFMGVNFASLEKVDNIKAQEGLTTPFGGVSIEYELFDHFRVAYSLGNMTKGGTFILDVVDEYGTIIGEISTKNSVQYLSNLISVKGRFGEKIMIYPEIGISLDALIGHQYKVGSFGSYPGRSESKKELYNPLNMGFVYGIGGRYMLNSKIGLGINFKISNGLSVLSDEPEVSFMAQKPTNYLCALDFVWRIHK